MNFRRVSSPQSSAHGDHVPRGASPATSKKRPRGSKFYPQVEDSSDKDKRSGKSDPAQSVLKDSSLSFACPFYKWDAEVYGGPGGCGSWANKSIESLIRYHVLDKHRKANKARIASGEAHYLDDIRFEEVDKLKRTKISGDSKEKQAEEKWNAIYTLLFEVSPESKNDVPDPYFKREAKSSNLGFGIDDLERMIRNRLPDRPSIIPESVDFVQEIAKLENERSRQKEKVQIAAAAREAQLKTQIRETKEKRAVQEQRIDAYFNDRISSVRSRYMAILSPGLGFQAEFYEDPPELPPFDLDIDFEFEPPTAPQIPPSQGSVEPSAYSQPSIFGESIAESLEQPDSTASSRMSAPLQWSINPSYCLNPCGLCAATSPDESLWCEGCRSLSELADIQ
jgi:hypothetical protein